MTTYIILTIVLELLSINAFNFLKAYIRLLKFGTQTDGVVVAYEGSRSIMTKNTLIPKLKFQTKQSQAIIGKPIHPWLMELNNHQLANSNVTVYDTLYPNNSS